MQVSAAGVAYLDGVRLRRALAAGIRRVIARQDHLNKINVFPVPDGDTGTNIAFTLNSVLSRMSASMERHAGRLMTTVADAALDGARGNSGAILAQFFQGLSDAAGDFAQLSAERFVEAVHNGAQYAREALAEPREGTLISVLADFAQELRRQLRSVSPPDFLALLERGLQRAEVSLADTPRQLPVLRKAGVVDAGAEGFVDLLRGIFEFAREGSLRDALLSGGARREADGESPAGAAADADLAHRYCTECIVTGEDIDLRKLREALAETGSSLVVAGGRRKAKVHIHVSEPQAVFRLAARFGRVHGEKADDMWQQRREAAADNSHAVAIVTDSGGDIPEAELERLNIHMVPVRVNFGDQSYLDKVSLTPAEFYRLQAQSSEPAKTSQPPPGDFRRQFQLLASHFEAVVSVNLTARVSGTWQAAASAAERVEGGVNVFDSRNVSVGQGLLVMYAAECARAGLGAPDILRALEIMRDRTFTWGLVPDLSHAVRGGRVPRSKQLLADLLHLTPVLHKTPDGQIRAGGVLAGRRNLTAKFTRFLLRRLNREAPARLLVGHANNPTEGQRLLETLRAALPRLEHSWLVDMGCALGAHAGPGALVVGFQHWTPPETLLGS